MASHTLLLAQLRLILSIFHQSVAPIWTEMETLAEELEWKLSHTSATFRPQLLCHFWPLFGAPFEALLIGSADWRDGFLAVIVRLLERHLQWQMDCLLPGASLRRLTTSNGQLAVAVRAF